MPKQAQPLTDAKVRNAKPTGKTQKLFDGGGLYCEITPLPIGSKLWRMSYRFNGKANTLAFGVYPIVTLQEARERREEAKKLLANGQNPSDIKKAQKAAGKERAANSFEVAARLWLKWREGQVDESQIQRATARLEKDVFPWLGGKPIADIEPLDILSVLKRIDERGARYTVGKIRGEISMIFRFAINEGLVKNNPAKDLIIPPARGKHFAAITEPAKAGELLRAIEGFKGTFPVQCALRLAPMFFVRPGELRKAEWKDFDLDKREWKFTVTKTRVEHLVPLAKQAVSILRELHPLTGHGKYVFPGRDPKKPMSEAAVNAALRRMGYDTKTEITGHGFRAMARTILAEELHQKPEVIEHQLAHRVPDALGTAYNRTKFLKERKEMMQIWADYLDGLRQNSQHPTAPISPTNSAD